MYLQVAFKTGEYKQQVIFIGGLTDGLLATEYVPSPFRPNFFYIFLVWLCEVFGYSYYYMMVCFPIESRFFFSCILIWWNVPHIGCFFSYLEPLAIALDKEKWSLVQLLMSSSYSGFGTSSLKQVKSLCLSVIWYGFHINIGKTLGVKLLNFFVPFDEGCTRDRSTYKLSHQQRELWRRCSTWP